jgi:hypothetical protein
VAVVGGGPAEHVIDVEGAPSSDPTARIQRQATRRAIHTKDPPRFDTIDGDDFISLLAPHLQITMSTYPSSVGSKTVEAYLPSERR